MKAGMSMIRKTNWCQLSLSLLASLATAALVGWVLVPNLIAWQILKGAVISPDINADLYSAWAQPKIPIYFKVHLFNCTNPSEVEKGMLPAVQEIGPYVFEQKREKINVTLDDVSDTATYFERGRYYFRKDLSGYLSLEDTLTIINVPFAGAAIVIDRDVPWPMNNIAHTILRNYKEPLFVNKTVEDILFKGWKVPFMEKIEEEIGLTLRENNTFAYFTGLNDTAQGPYTVQRGRNDRNLFGTLIKYKNETTLRFWGNGRNSYCNQIYGTDGTIYPPFIEKNSKLKIFNAEVCRSLYLTYNADTDFEGIHGYRFTVPTNLSKEVLEDETCFCLESDRSKCLKLGAVDMSPCRNGDPVAMSGTHFIGDVDPSHFSTIKGNWKPEKAKHETFIDVEPITGTVMNVSKKLQVSLMLKPVKSIKSMKNVKENLFPLFWADECAWLDAASTESLKVAMLKIHGADYGLKVVVVLLATFVPVFILLISNVRKSKERTLKKRTLASSKDKTAPAGSIPLINEIK